MPKQRGRISSLFGGATDEEMGKKDDDRKPAPAPTAWAPARIPSRRSARRLAVLLAFFGIIYFTYSMFRPTDEFRDYVPSYPTYEPPGPAQFNRVWPPSSKPLKGGDGAAGQGSSASRDGKTSLSLPALPSTLKEIEKAGKNEENRHVLFASSSLKSAAALLPLACEMGRQGNNYVHYALMSRGDMPIRKLKKIHGIDDSCGITFHGME